MGACISKKPQASSTGSRPTIPGEKQADDGGQPD
jgi:hypothetical protein